ncbi:M15 family metallopeptidase [Chryseotalea sanaruensis]|uniref:M15 family metallopeptidase n=1 Tax=Chryseotalea sanaruensis TaxID=2482724 RepID=UPI000F8CB8AB|nr:M15 family metallopeptidase [Chryseotalea sanaruensis]
MRSTFLGLFFLFIFNTYGVAQHPYLNILEDRSLRFDTTYWVNVANLLAFDTLHAWQEWQIAENYNFGKNRGDLQMITDLQALHPYFRDKVIQLIENCKKKGIEVSVVESYRTRAKQAEYFGMGKKYTRSAGGKSKHQYGLACDLVPVVNGSAQWEDKVLWRKVGVEGEKLGLRWGGRWRNPYDPAHFEWTGGLTTVQLAAGYFPKPKVQIYPCIDEDIRILRKFWEAWENEQATTSRLSKIKSLTSSLNP